MMPRMLLKMEDKISVKDLGSCTLAIEEGTEGMKHPVCNVSLEVGPVL